ncbi:unnamed protein product, partial [Protopolystoma xenopodis]
MHFDRDNTTTRLPSSPSRPTKVDLLCLRRSRHTDCLNDISDFTQARLPSAFLPKSCSPCSQLAHLSSTQPTLTTTSSGRLRSGAPLEQAGRLLSSSSSSLASRSTS